MNDNFENFYFFYNAKKILYNINLQIVEYFFGEHTNPRILVLRLEYNNDLSNYEEVDVIKDNVLTIVYKAKIKNNFYPEEYVALKTIKKILLRRN